MADIPDYAPTDWEDDPSHATPIDEAHLDHIEGGIDRATDQANAAYDLAVAASGAAGVSSFNTRTGAVSLTKADVTGTGLAAADISAAPTASPTFTGHVTVPTPTSSTDAATKDYVDTAAGGGGGLGIYGDGSDGSVTLDGTTNVLGMIPSSNVYTMTRDLFCTDITINSGITLDTKLWRIFVSGTLTNNGTIRCNGRDATTSTGATALSNNASSINAAVSTPFPGQAGSNGGTTTGTGGTSQSGSYSLGSGGGSGGAGASGSGGVGGSITTTTPKAAVPPRAVPFSVLGVWWTALSTSRFDVPFIYGGAGGGGGGGDGTNKGGGGGSGGGICLVVAKAFAGTGAVQARGGAGATLSTGDVGGGGGGGGGVVIVTSGSVASGAISGQTIDANGGTAGSGHGTGSNGTAGNNGTVILVPN